MTTPTLDSLWHQTEVRSLFLLLGAVLLGLCVHALVHGIHRMLVRKSWRGRIALFVAGGEDRFEALGNSLLQQLSNPRSQRWIQAFSRQQRWVELEGGSVSLPRMLGIATVIAGIGVLGLFQQMPAISILGLAGAIYPFVRLRAQVRRIRRRTERALPELLTLMAAEMSAGVPVDRALQRAGGFGGPLSALIHRALQESQRSRVPMFGRGRAPGTWRQVVEQYDLPSLRAFAIQIEIAARKGAAGPELMESLSRSLILAYKDQALREVEKFENRLAVPSVLFFFLPLMVLVLTPLLLPLMASLT